MSKPLEPSKTPLTLLCRRCSWTLGLDLSSPAIRLPNSPRLQQLLCYTRAGIKKIVGKNYLTENIASNFHHVFMASLSLQCLKNNIIIMLYVYIYIYICICYNKKILYSYTFCDWEKYSKAGCDQQVTCRLIKNIADESKRLHPSQWKKLHSYQYCLRLYVKCKHLIFTSKTVLAA